MPVTLKDIANYTGVSVSTVSRILNNDTKKPASLKTQKLVWDAVNKLHYAPNLTARNLAKGYSNDNTFLNRKSIGCIYTSTKNATEDPFFFGITTGVQTQCAKLGYEIAYCFSVLDETIGTVDYMLKSATVQGIVIIGRFEESLIKELSKYNKNLIYAGINSMDFKISEVICDSNKAVKIGVEHLISLGHKKIGYIGPSNQNENGTSIFHEHRYKAFCDTLTLNKIDVLKQYNKIVDLTVEKGYQSMLNIIESGNVPTAMFCGCDELAIGAIKACTVKGLSVPEDIAIVGMEDIELASYITPALTTVRIPKHEIGKWAVKLLLEQYENKTEITTKIEFPCELCVRASCGKYK